MHDDGAHLAVVLEREPEDQQRSLGGDEKAHLFGQRETAGRFPVLGADQLAGVLTQKVPFGLVQVLPVRHATLHEVAPVLGEQLGGRAAVEESDCDVLAAG